MWGRVTAVHTFFPKVLERPEANTDNEFGPGWPVPSVTLTVFHQVQAAMFDISEHPHRRLNLLTGEWLLVSPHRARRPWLGRQETVNSVTQPKYDPDCYLCPGNKRAGGQTNPLYRQTFVFDNDFPALMADSEEGSFDNSDLLLARSERGICRVVCFSPRHDLALSGMPLTQVEAVVQVWVDQFRELSSQPGINYVLIFENRGELMGCSNPHPHCQIWSNESLPNEPAKEQENLARFFSARKECLLCSYLGLETRLGQRIVFANEGFVVLVPFWAIWPFETLVISRQHVAALDQLEDSQIEQLAEALKQVTTRYDNLFGTPFPYSMGFHQRPTDGHSHPEWHLHAHFFPPLLRSANIRKFMVGYEMLGTPQRDITAETAAARLRTEGFS